MTGKPTGKPPAKTVSSKTPPKRKPWSTSDVAVADWINKLVWNLIGGLEEETGFPSIADIPENAIEVLRHVLFDNGLEAVAAAFYGEPFLAAVGPEFYATVQSQARRTEIYLQELGWIFGPSVGPCMIPVGAFPMRKLYRQMATPGKPNPRLLRQLELWTPTLSTREEVSSLLKKSGYEAKSSDDGYVFAKETLGTIHTIILRGVLWPANKSWSSDVERAMWDRAQPDEIPGTMRLDRTDEFVLACRQFAVNSLVGGAIELMDLTRMLAQYNDVIDWDRVRQIKNSFLKTEWFWAALVGVAIYEEKMGMRFELPEWARAGISEDTDTFWPEFVASRLAWANPDTRLFDFSRAQAKLSPP
jgi:hypothetical protein